MARGRAAAAARTLHRHGSSGESPDPAVCTRFHAAVELIGRRWNGVILQRLMEGPLRFSELRKGIPQLTDAVLTQRLRELEEAAVLERRVSASRPVQVRYALTPIGLQLAPILTAIAEWGHDWATLTEPELDPGDE